jgi:hypothetical protein
VKSESNETVSRIGVKAKASSTVSADNNVQLIAKHDTNVGVEFNAGALCWGSHIVNTSTITTKDETFSMYDSVNNTSEDWDVIKPFSAPFKLEAAPQTSFSSSIGLSVSTRRANQPSPSERSWQHHPAQPSPPATSSSQPATPASNEVSSTPSFGVIAVNLSTPTSSSEPTTPAVTPSSSSESTTSSTHLLSSDFSSPSFTMS